MPRILKALAVLLIPLLAACGTPGPPKRVWPPQATLQELAVQEDGSWRLRVRVQNFSTVPMQFSRVEAELRVGQVEAGRLSLAPDIRIGPSSAETLDTILIPAADAIGPIRTALDSGHGVRYALEGQIFSSDPRRSDRFTHQSVLSPVPGLTGVLR